MKDEVMLIPSPVQALDPNKGHEYDGVSTADSQKNGRIKPKSIPIEKLLEMHLISFFMNSKDEV